MEPIWLECKPAEDGGVMLVGAPDIVLLVLPAAVAEIPPEPSALNCAVPLLPEALVMVSCKSGTMLTAEIKFRASSSMARPYLRTA